MNLKIKYLTKEIEELYSKAGVQTDGSAGFDLCTAEDVTLATGEIKLISLGVVIKLPPGHHALVIPRSSTAKKYRIMQANSCGLIDEDYCGPNDIWRFPAYYVGEDTLELKAGTRICQLILQRTIPIDSVESYDPSEQKDRGGFGSTGD